MRHRSSPNRHTQSRAVAQNTPFFVRHARLLVRTATVLLIAIVLAGVATAAHAKDALPHNWSELPAAEQRALSPLQTAWTGLNADDRAKWRELASNFDKLPAQQQSRLRSRMLEWANMSTAERTVARENFLKSRSPIASAERKAQWEAYQALSAEEKRKLANQAKQK